MKTLIALSFICTAACKTLSAVDIPLPPQKQRSSQDLQVINVCSLSENDLQEITKGLHPKLAVEFSAGTILPVSFFLKGDLVKLIEEDEPLATLQIEQTFYARCVEDELIFSLNLTDWKPLLEFITGSSSITLNIQDGKAPSVTVGSETNHRS